MTWVQQANMFLGPPITQELNAFGEKWGSQFARGWKGFFLRLEQRFYLDRKTPHHIWLINFLFLADIQESCIEFQELWNHHAISGTSTRERSPKVGLQPTVGFISLISNQDLRNLGTLAHGFHSEVADDEFLRDNMTILGKYFGAIAAAEVEEGVDPPSDSEAEDEDISDL